MDTCQQYSVILGGGGYGVVKTGVDYPDNTIAVKFLKQGCNDAKKEYITNRKVYDAYKIFLRCHYVSNISVVKPYEFVNGSTNIVCGDNTYSCLLKMERLFSPMKDGYAVHIAINGQMHVSQLNKLVMSGNVPRGYFYDSDHILKLIKGSMSLADVTYRIGVLDGICIFGAHYAPIDAEYILTVNKEDELYVTMIDFGLFTPLEVTYDTYKSVASYISDAQDDNLYYHPHSDEIPFEFVDEARNAFIQGISDAYNCFKSNNNESYDLLYKSLIELYLT